MLSLVGHLVESEAAPLYGTQEGSLACVDAEVVEEIVPLGKELATARVVTGKDARLVASPNIFIAEVAEPKGRRQVGFEIEYIHVDRLPRLAYDFLIG